MVDRRDIGSWLGGPQLASPDDDYAGQRLGLPSEGRGSLARMGRRIAALFIDWGLSMLIAAAFLDYQLAGGHQSNSFGPLLVFFVENLLLVGTLGYTVGHRIMGLRVVAADGGYAGPVRALIRTLLLCVVIPAAVWDRDNRGLHDRLAGTVLVRS
ncbi:MAG: RDD family protein [Austwickia sp.]|nr:RDD family protein [Actinomycetota bacterium]MCB1255035.1 RDD family protein [Austwickia sp.]MCO5309734.1 RDD family protein [Austwickia sp.]